MEDIPKKHLLKFETDRSINLFLATDADFFPTYSICIHRRFSSCLEFFRAFSTLKDRSSAAIKTKLTSKNRTYKVITWKKSRFFVHRQLLVFFQTFVFFCAVVIYWLLFVTLACLTSTCKLLEEEKREHLSLWTRFYFFSSHYFSKGSKLMHNFSYFAVSQLSPIVGLLVALLHARHSALPD